jgi:NADPH:quinone reductase-like Zn-dependent oxidoreductase
MITTEAWILDRGAGGGGKGPRASPPLRLATYRFDEPDDSEVLVEPIYGSWEGNMTHAICRDPVDICEQRREDAVVIGNAGVVRVLRPGRSATGLREGDLCLVFCNGVPDASGYPVKIYGYDAPRTVGILAKRTKLHTKQLIRIPARTRGTLQQWAAFSLRYVTAWANWKAAFGCWRALQAERDHPNDWIWGWGGGVTLAEATLARLSGCRAAMISSDPDRLGLIHRLGLVPVDRRRFSGLDYDPARYEADAGYRDRYLDAEQRFLDTVWEATRGAGVSIFIDFVGAPVYRATLKALARPGVVTTAGWKGGMRLSSIRALECLGWHTHVHTHFARYHEGVEAVRFAERSEWMPDLDGHVYAWEEIARLANDQVRGEVSTYFPIFRVNPP